MGGAAGDNHVGGYVLGHHTARSHDGILANGHTRQHLHVGTEPGVAAYDDGLGEQCVSRGGVFGVVLGGQHTVGTDESTVADGDATDGQQCASEVKKAVVAEAHAGTIVNIKRCEDTHGVGHMAAGNLTQAVAHFGLSVVAAVHLGTEPHGALHVGIQFVAADIVFPVGMGSSVLF